MQRAGSTCLKSTGKRVSYGAGSVVEAAPGDLDHVPGAESYGSADEAAEAGK